MMTLVGKLIGVATLLFSFQAFAKYPQMKGTYRGSYPLASNSYVTLRFGEFGNLLEFSPGSNRNIKLENVRVKFNYRQLSKSHIQGYEYELIREEENGETHLATLLVDFDFDDQDHPIPNRLLVIYPNGMQLLTHRIRN